MQSRFLRAVLNFLEVKCSPGECGGVLSSAGSWAALELPSPCWDGNPILQLSSLPVMGGRTLLFLPSWTLLSFGFFLPFISPQLCWSISGPVLSFQSSVLLPQGSGNTLSDILWAQKSPWSPFVFLSVLWGCAARFSLSWGVPALLAPDPF